ncbi:hypothetical protein [Heyndrickxia acidicola]|uniref:NADH dehydrogenase subunit 1 n=1 Tax=Heyndrickxia acidicola TaxID=209389 RepID=A0ABU6MH27_9BACI|nr:hypothetical protein [Heyndrickxia acidicola]MED1203974.1 hypothetical protein [Heyndrickxia acidicola]
MYLQLYELAVTPRFIVVVILSILYLVILKKEKGFFTILFKICAIIYILLYLVALYMYLFQMG